MQFTCNLCGCTTISPVNPHAFHSGSLFARCGNTECGVIHKVERGLVALIRSVGCCLAHNRHEYMALLHIGVACNMQVKDNLKLFHEVRGPIFRPQQAVRLPTGIKRPRVLPGMRVGGVDILNRHNNGRGDSS